MSQSNEMKWNEMKWRGVWSAAVLAVWWFIDICYRLFGHDERCTRDAQSGQSGRLDSAAVGRRTGGRYGPGAGRRRSAPRRARLRARYQRPGHLRWNGSRSSGQCLHGRHSTVYHRWGVTGNLASIQLHSDSCFNNTPNYCYTYHYLYITLLLSSYFDFALHSCFACDLIGADRDPFRQVVPLNQSVSNA